MSSLIFYTDAAQALVATDTLAVSNNGEPFKFTTKAILVPHLHLVLCVTGAHGMLGRWFVQVNDWTEVRDLDHLNYHTPNQLNSLWREYHDEIAVPEGATVTIYHIGFSLEARVIHAYAYRSTNQFRSELLPYGLAVKPECPVLDHYELPTDIRRMMDTQRTIEAVRPPHERVYIGGEIQIHHLTMDGCSIYSLGRFEDYEQHEQSMYENFRPNPQNRLGLDCQTLNSQKFSGKLLPIVVHDIPHLQE
jgi:hypothetical protein